MTPRAVLFMYVGNLEPYQGLDLLLDSMALLHAQRPADRLVIIGGSAGHVAAYRKRAARLQIDGVVELRGPQPVARLLEILREADVLVSPRIKGTNTPMKIYSYLDSGKPVLATRLFTHTQVLTDAVALLAEPHPEPFAAAMARLAGDPALRAALGARGRELVRTSYSEDAFKQTLDTIYAYVEARTATTPSEAAGTGATRGD